MGKKVNRGLDIMSDTNSSLPGKPKGLIIATAEDNKSPFMFNQNKRVGYVVIPGLFVCSNTYDFSFALS